MEECGKKPSPAIMRTLDTTRERAAEKGGGNGLQKKNYRLAQPFLGEGRVYLEGRN